MVERVLLIVLLSFGMFYRTLRLGLVSDDIPAQQSSLKTNNFFQRIWFQLIGKGHYQPQEAHFITMILHTLTCVFIYLSLGSNDVSFIASLLFCINPRNTQGSIWISGRYSYLIPTMMLMLAPTIPILSPFSIWYATRAATVFLTPIGYLGSPNWWIVSLMPLIWFINLKHFRNQVGTKLAIESLDSDRLFKPRKLILAVKTYAFYLFMCIVPDKLTFYHAFMQSAAGSGNELMNKRAYSLDRLFWFGCLFLGTWLITGIHHWTPVHWGILWFSVSILPYLNIIRCQQEIAERYVYCANVGVMFSLACMIINNPVLIIMFLTLYAVRLWYFLPAYRDEYWLREYGIIEEPSSWFAWHMRGLHRWDVGSKQEALTMWVMARMISPLEFKVNFNIGTVLTLVGNKKEAEKYYQYARENIVKGQEREAEKLFNDVKSGNFPILT